MLVFMSFLLNAQDWQLKKNENGIKVYTSKRENSNLLMYKVETTLNANYKDVYYQVVDFEDNKKNLESVKKLKILSVKPEKEFVTYMIFDLPWPLSDRDLLVGMTVTKKTSGYNLVSESRKEPVAEKEDYVRIKEFREEWDISYLNKNSTKVKVVGWANPGGAIPVWVVNMFVVGEPYAFMAGVKKAVENK